MKSIYILILLGLVIYACSTEEMTNKSMQSRDYLDYSGTEAELSGGVQMIPIKTEKGTFNVWTKRVGNNPDIKVLLLHGGPGGTHEFFESFDSYFPKAGIEYYYYDQLGSHYSDQPMDSSLWTIEHFVEEVEQVRQGLGLDSSNFYILGNSWGGILGMEYALKYQNNMKALLISNMVSSIPEYSKYANEVLGPQLPPEVLAEVRALEEAGDYLNPRYSELLMEHYYTKHILRMPLEEWPNPVMRAFEHLNYDLYLHMQGPSEFGVVGDAVLKNWDRSDDLDKIKIPTLSIGAEYDTMDPDKMEWMAEQFPKGRYLHCPNGSHLAYYDDQEVYFNGVIDFIMDVDQGKI